MHTLYQIVSGPLVWLAFGVFLFGSVYRIWEIFRLAQRKEKFIISHMSLKYGLRSVIHWLTPFGTLNMRLHPVMTIVSFTFHICLLLVPVFLLAHIILWEESWGVSWWALPDTAADIMTLAVPAACVFFAARRALKPEVRYVTGTSDYLFLIAVALPFLSGFYCDQQWPGYAAAMIVHIVSGELMLAILPFTRIGHMIVFWFTRSYMGSEFGAVRHARDY